MDAVYCLVGGTHHLLPKGPARGGCIFFNLIDERRKVSTPPPPPTYAERLQIAACQRLCSGKRASTQACRMGCYVQLAGISYFYHGSAVEVMDALTTEFASTV